jgi:hypothetical protein
MPTPDHTSKMLTEDMPAPRTSQSQFESLRGGGAKPQMLTEEEEREEELRKEREAQAARGEKPRGNRR